MVTIMMTLMMFQQILWRGCGGLLHKTHIHPPMSSYILLTQYHSPSCGHFRPRWVLAYLVLLQGSKWNVPNSVRNSTGFVCHMWFYILIATLEVDVLSGKCNQQDPLVAWNPFHVLLKNRKELDEDSLDGKEVRGIFCTNKSCSISSIWSRWGGWSGLTNNINQVFKYPYGRHSLAFTIFRQSILLKCIKIWIWITIACIFCQFLP